jgi:alpha-mannosidase
MDVATSQEVPSQIVTVDGQTYLRILASEVPSVGYKVFEIRRGREPLRTGDQPRTLQRACRMRLIK